jgi:ATP-dependent DNA helicase RecG
LVTLFKNNLTEEQLIKLGLSERQIRAVEHVKDKGEITTSKYTEIFGVSKRTARNDLSELVDKQIFKKVGETNIAKYILD